jgi:tRNA dimethylallyltransferase
VTLKADSRQGPALLVICGPTASGKTALALELAERYAAEIVSADSRQLYRLMNIGTAKPTAAEQSRARHHLIDVANPDQEFHAARYAELAAAAIADIAARHSKPLLVGGTGLYIKALTEGLLDAPGADLDLRRRLHARAAKLGSAALHAELSTVDPHSAARLHPNDLVRIVRALEVYEKSGRPLSELQREHAFAARPYRTLKLGLDPGREELDRRIDRRAETMFATGLLDEAEALLAAGYDPSCKALRTIGYRQAFAVLRGEMGRAEALDELKRVTRRYARQQQTWFHRDKSIIWLESSADFVTIQAFIEDFYAI